MKNDQGNSFSASGSLHFILVHLDVAIVCHKAATTPLQMSTFAAYKTVHYTDGLADPVLHGKS